MFHFSARTLNLSFLLRAALIFQKMRKAFVLYEFCGFLRFFFFSSDGFLTFITLSCIILFKY